MKKITGLLLLTFLVALLWGVSPSNLDAAPARSAAGAGGVWSTGAQGTLGDVVYSARTEPYLIDLETTGEYDPVRWHVILDYNTLTIEAGATVRFLNHSTRAPVVIRALGAIVIDGELNLDGADGHESGDYPSHAEPGPGGFRGGTGAVTSLTEQSDGFGPGGGLRGLSGTGYASGSHATAGLSYTGTPGPTYGSGYLLPLVGGSGGTGVSNSSLGGGAGGGAILLGSDTSIHLGGVVSALGGGTWGWGNSGSGGSILIASPQITWAGSGDHLDASSVAAGGHGWIRVETIGTPTPGPVPSVPGAFHAQRLSEFLPDTFPTVTVASWWDRASATWVSMDQDPRAIIDSGRDADVQLPATGKQLLRLEGRDVPIGSPLHVRVTHADGRAVILDPLPRMGEVPGSTQAMSWTDVVVDFSLGISTVQVRAELR